MKYLIDINVPTIVVGGILLIIVVSIIAYLFKNRKKGCCGCSNETCHYRNQKKGCNKKR